MTGPAAALPSQTAGFICGQVQGRHPPNHWRLLLRRDRGGPRDWRGVYSMIVYGCLQVWFYWRTEDKQVEKSKQRKEESSGNGENELCSEGQKKRRTGWMFGGSFCTIPSPERDISHHLTPCLRKEIRQDGRKKEGGEQEAFCRSWEQQASATGIVPLVIPGFPRMRQEVDQAG